MEDRPKPDKSDATFKAYACILEFAKKSLSEADLK